MVRRTVRYTSNGKISERTSYALNINDIVKDKYFLKYLGYDSYKDFMIAHGSRTNISEKKSRQIVTRMIDEMVEYMKDELLEGRPVYINTIATMQLAEAKPNQKKQLIGYFEKDYSIVVKTTKLYLRNYKRAFYVFPTKRMKGIILNCLKNGKSFGIASWLQ